MLKPIYASKTIWGFGIALAVVGLQQVGVLDTTAVSEIIKYASSIVGVWGARDALE